MKMVKNESNKIYLHFSEIPYCIWT